MDAFLLIRSYASTIYALGIVALAAIALTALKFNVPVETPGLGILLFGSAGVILGRIAAAAGGRAPKASAQAAPSQAPWDKVDGILRSLAKILQAQVSDNDAYSERLNGASARLSQHTSAGPITEIVMALIDDNREMREKLSKTRDQLEESRLRVLQLQNNLERSEEAGLRDVVTMIGNRRFFDLALSQELERARRTGGGLCLALADLDRFKLVNDRFGHLVGDRLLRLFAEILTQNVRGQDRVARYGGEEFAILLPGTGIDEAAQAVQRIRKVLESKQWTLETSGERVGRVTASFGVAKLRPNDTGADLLQRADTNLYEAKARGRNCVVAEDNDANLDAARGARIRRAASG